MKLTVEFFELLRSRVNVSDVVRKRVVLTKRGAEYSGLCPFHDEKSPSFTVNDIKRFYHCFGCGAHGDAIKFVSETSGLGYRESAIKIAEDYGIEIPKLSKQEEKLYEEIDQIYHVLNLAADFFQSKLNDKAKSYLQSRLIGPKIIDDFSLGYAPSGGALKEHLESKKISMLMMSKAGLIGKGEDGRVYDIFRERIIFPIKNIYGKVIGFGGRTMGDAMPKYLNSPETIVFKKNETLYGEDKAIGEAYRLGNMIVVEGYMDVIALQAAGFKNTVASLGTAITTGHIQKLWRSADEIIICLDGDSAGIRACYKVIEQALPQVTYNKKVSFVILPSGSDPDDVIKNSGANKFKALLEQRLSLSEMIWYLETSGKAPTSAEGKAALEHKLENYADAVTDATLKRNFARFFKDSMWQYLNNKKQNKKSAAHIELPTQMTESSMLEHSILSVLVKLPQLLCDNNVQETLSAIHFTNKDLGAFRDYLLGHITQNQEIDSERLSKIIEKTSFFKLFVLLVAPSAIFLDISRLKAGFDPILLWEMLIRKYHLLKIKQEYSALLSDMTEQSFLKVQSYQQEIIKNQQAIEEINEVLIQSGEHDGKF